MAEGAAERAGVRGWLRYRVVVYFVVALAAVDAVVASRRAVWRAYDPDDYRTKVHDCRARPRDLVIVGGSPVSEGINPALLSGLVWRGRPLESVYNLGLPGATTSEIWHSVEHGIATPPRLLLYGITASDVNDGRDEPHGPRSIMQARDVAEWVRLRPGAGPWCVRHYAFGRCSRAWNLYHFRNGLRLWAADRAEALRPGTFPEAAQEARDGLRYSAALARGDGFAPRPEFQAGNLAHMKANGNFPPFAFLDKYRLGGHLRYLHKLLDWGEVHGVPVVLVDMPVSEELNRQHPGAFTAYAAALAEVERARGVRVLRPTREALGLTDDDFADLIHLNEQGSTKVSKWLKTTLGGGRD
jgi:hypothetical protein